MIVVVIFSRVSNLSVRHKGYLIMTIHLLIFEICWIFAQTTNIRVKFKSSNFQEMHYFTPFKLFHEKCRKCTGTSCFYFWKNSILQKKNRTTEITALRIVFLQCTIFLKIVIFLLYCSWITTKSCRKSILVSVCRNPTAGYLLDRFPKPRRKVKFSRSSMLLHVILWRLLVKIFFLAPKIAACNQ